MGPSPWRAESLAHVCPTPKENALLHEDALLALSAVAVICLGWTNTDMKVVPATGKEGLGRKTALGFAEL